MKKLFNYAINHKESVFFFSMIIRPALKLLGTIIILSLILGFGFHKSLPQVLAQSQENRAQIEASHETAQETRSYLLGETNDTSDVPAAYVAVKEAQQAAQEKIDAAKEIATSGIMFDLGYGN